MAGAQASIELPVADWWLSGIVTGLLMQDWPVREVGIQALEGNQVAIRIHLRRPSFLPPIKVRLAIEKQPHLPASPVLVLQLFRDGITDIARTALKFLDALPPGVQIQGDRVLVDIGTLARRNALGDVLDYLTKLAVTTTEGRVVLLVEAAVSPATAANVRP